MVDDAIRERSWRLYQAHRAWVLRQIAKGVDGPVPPGRPEGSDYNQHYPDMEADGAAMDEYAAIVAEIMGREP